MDYLDTKKELRHRIIIMVGYVLIAVAIVIAALVLLYQAYGFGITKNGTVIQNGLAFISSQPHPANIYVNGQLKNVRTNTRVVLPGGVYGVRLSRDGYRDWQRTVDLKGGDVVHFDYPFLFPAKLVTKKLTNQAALPAAPALMTQSPDRRWLILQQGGIDEFAVYDLKNPDKPALPLALPANLLNKATNGESWQLVEWAADNDHVLLQHGYDGKVEYVMIDRSNPAQSLNLNTALAANPVKLTLNNRKYDQYYAHDPASGSLQRLSLKQPTPVPVLEHVLAYKTYSDDTVLYVTDAGAPNGKGMVNLKAGDKIYPLRALPASNDYLVDLTKYAGTMYVALGAGSDDRVFIYRDPIGQLNRQPDHVAVSSRILRVDGVNYLKFSQTAQFIMAENGNHFGVYDIENKLAYNYVTGPPLDTPQSHADWMDGNRLLYVSAGQLMVFDYDDTNQQTLMSAASAYPVAFAPDYKYVYALTSNAAGQPELQQTALLIPTDL